MQNCPQTDTQSVYQHGISVKNCTFQLINYLKESSLKGKWKLPEWLNFYKKTRHPFPWQVEMNPYIIGANNRNLEFSLSEEEFKNLSLLPCYYCGEMPSKKCKSVSLREINILKNGIDRLDSKLGYTTINCVPCCTICNMEKMDKSTKDFIQKTKQRYEHLLSNNLFKELL